VLEKKQGDLQKRKIAYRITGIASAGAGSPIPKAFPSRVARAALAHEILPASQPCDVRDWLREAQADVLFEATSLNVNSGQPAIDHIRAALEMGAHAITANEGTVVHAYHELRALAASKNRRFFSSQP
jgi:homoserine dehydrogenase